ncbi:MAG: metallophosphoesterase [Thermoproteota archaeon]
MKIWDKIELVEPYPAIYIFEEDCLVISDLHLGYEGVMAEQGIMMPKVQFEEEIEMLEGILAKRRSNRIILNGDIKHEFSKTSYHEFKEVTDLLSFLTESFEEVLIVKGNHDNYIERVTSKHGIDVKSSFSLGRFHLSHGHRRIVRGHKVKSEFLIIGHEHPAIALFDEVGAKERISCFLYGESTCCRILVTPAFSTLAPGSEVNTTPQKEWLSPTLREDVRIEDLEVVGVSHDTGLLRFGRLIRLIDSA